jgi:Kef-type K+ transport system membrane component KefB
VTFFDLAVIAFIALLGPLLAVPRAWHLPVVLGELAGGIALGSTGFRFLHATDATFTFLANIGFALVMFVAGSHVPVLDPRLSRSLGRGALRALGVGAVAGVLGVVLARVFGIDHAPLYAVLMASSSAALVLPVVDSLSLHGPALLQLLPQVAVADTACIVALPLAIDPSHALRATAGAALVIGVGLVLWLILRWGEHSGLRRRLHDLSEEREFALELRISLVILFAIAALAVSSHVSIMLAGFTFGLAVAAIGEPRRLAKQLFALAEGFLAPLFFVWLGASLNLRELGSHPKLIGLGIVLGIGAAVAHGITVFTGQPGSLALLASAQLGVPVAAATVGTQLHALRPGESSALILGALVAIALAVIGASMAAGGGAAGDLRRKGSGASRD